MFQLNSDQLDHLAKLCFDIARASILLFFIPGEITKPLGISLLHTTLYLIAGTTSIYFGLMLLKAKENLI